MARDLNHVVIIGRLVRDPEIKYTPSGAAVTKFSVATNDSFTQNNELKEYVSYFDINVWGNQAVNCEKYLQKGRQVAIEGRLRQNRWTDNASGQTRSKIEITANSVQFLTPNTAGGGGQAPMQKDYNAPPAASQGSRNGFIEDPWGDSTGGGGGGSDPSMPKIDSDDDIPF